MGFRFLAVAALAAFSAVGIQATPAPQQCLIENVCYIIDQSGSIVDSEYTSEQNFVIRVANEIQDESSVTPSNSAVAFSDFAQTIRLPTTVFSEFDEAVRERRIFRGLTSISSGLNQCRTVLNNAQGNKVMVLITDGQANSGDINPSKQAAADAKAAGIDIVTVGIGNGVSADFLMEIASEPSLFIDANFDDLNQRIPDVVEAICDTQDPTECEKAFNECRFTFAERRGLETFPISGEPDMGFTSRVVPKDVTYSLGVLNTNNIVPEFIFENGEKRAITEFGSQRFTPTHFKPYWIAQERGSGIGHQTFHGNQEQVAKNKCVRIFFTSFQEIRENRVVNRNNVPRTENKCVVFKTE